MIIVGMGTNVYENVEELTYNLLTAVELSVLPTGEVVDFTTMAPNRFGQMAPTEIKFGGKTLKASIDHNDIHYAGENEIMLSPLESTKQVNDLMALLLNKMAAAGDELLSFYMTEHEEEDGIKTFAMNVKFADREVSSKYYYNKCLAIIDCIFELAEYDVDLSNFNVPLEIK